MSVQMNMVTCHYCGADLQIGDKCPAHGIDPAPRRTPYEPFPCGYCRDSRKTLYFGSGPFAELRACSSCSTGEKLADTTIPVVQSNEPGRHAPHIFV